MRVDRYTTLHRKDERGVIVESRVFGPDDEIPEGFSEGDYSPIYAPREDHQDPVAESNLTPWDSPIAKGTWIGETNEAVEQAAEDVEPDEDPDDEDDELDDGSVLQARQQAGEELTEAEQAALAAYEAEDDESEDEGDELDDGSPLQAREQAGEELTEAEQEALEQATSDATEKMLADVQPPPKGGAGSGADAWAAYAEAKGVEVPEGATRDDIIAACEKAGVPVD